MGCSQSPAMGARKRLRTSPSEGSHRMDAAVRSPLSNDIRCAVVHQAENGQPSLRASSSFRAVWLFETPSTLERRCTHAAAEPWGMLDPIDGFGGVAGGMLSLLVRQLLMGSVLGHHQVFARS